MAKKLSAKQQAFIDEYLIDLNAYQAAIRAGYAESTALAQSYAWVGKDRNQCPEKMRHVWDAVKARMDERSKRVQIEADDVVRQLARMGIADPRRLFHSDGRVKAPHELDDDIAMAIQSVDTETRTDRDGITTVTYKYKLADRVKPLELIGKHLGKRLGQWGDRVEHDVPSDSPLAALVKAINGKGNTLAPVDDENA